MADISMFINRLRKNIKHWDKWAKRRKIYCYRVYDRDIPEFPVAIDRYEEHLHVQEFTNQWNPSADQYQHWKHALLEAVSDVTETPLGHIHFKQRTRQKGKQQYQKHTQADPGIIVREGDCRYWVKLDQYLDTGLFLDHRNTRDRVRKLCTHKRFLNLFAYTGSFTVNAVKGGACQSTTVDLSKTYVEWTRKNFALNQIDPNQHRLVQADVLTFLQQADRSHPYDMIVLDPPSFSNSKRMSGVFDVQRDHVPLIQTCLSLLSSDGQLMFSNNLRSFTLDEQGLRNVRVEEISRQTVPEDFRNKKIHRAWLIRH